MSDLRAQLEDLRRDAPLVTLALGIAAAYALLDIAHGVAGFIEGLLTNQSSDGGLPISFLTGGNDGLSWRLGHRVLTFDRLVTGLIELGVVVSAAVLVRRRSGYLPADEL